LTSNDNISEENALEKVIEEASKGKYQLSLTPLESLTDNRDDGSKTILFPSNNNITILETNQDNTNSNTQESKLCVANEQSPVIMMNKIEQPSESQIESSDQVDIYFSCHERMVNGEYAESENTVFKGIFTYLSILAKNEKSIMDYSSIRDSREIVTMPEMNRSTLMDQIDYDLDNYKINESSVCTNSIDLSKH